MKIIYGICGSCDYVGEYSEKDVKHPALVACKRCKSRSVWRIYNNAELERIMWGERVE